MSLYSALLRTFILRPLLARDNRESALRHWRFFEHSQYWPRQRLLDYQWEKLTALLHHAYDTCPYYRRVFDERGLTPTSFKDTGDLVKLPTLNRDTILTEGANLLSTKYDRNSLQHFTTGGTTGVRTELYRDQESFNVKMGIQWRHEGWIGRKPCDKFLLIWPANVDFLHDGGWREDVKSRWLYRQVQYQAGSHRDDDLQVVYENSRRFNAEYMKVFPSALETFVEYMQRKNLPRLHFKTIMSTGEPLYDHQRRVFEEYFEAEVFDMYGSREVGNTACESPAHDGLLMAMETSIVEFLDNGLPVPVGQPGDVVITDLTNYAMPMIRYEINDQGLILEGTSSCGRELLRMSGAVGRDTDDVWTAEGVRHSGHIVAIMLTEHGPDVGQVQVVQKSLYEFHARVLNRPEPTQANFDHISKSLRGLIGDDTIVTFEVVENIPREKSGKVRFVISELDAQTRQRLAAMNRGRR